MRKLTSFLVLAGLTVSNFSFAAFGNTSNPSYNSADQADKWQNIDKVQGMNPGGPNVPANQYNSNLNQPNSGFNNNSSTTRPLNTANYNQTNPTSTYYQTNPSAGTTYQDSSAGMRNSTINRGTYPVNAGGNPVNQGAPDLNNSGSSSTNW